jgi:hypothetical protein
LAKQYKLSEEQQAALVEHSESGELDNDFVEEIERSFNAKGKTIPGLAKKSAETAPVQSEETADEQGNVEARRVPPGQAKKMGAAQASTPPGQAKKANGQGNGKNK